MTAENSEPTNLDDVADDLEPSYDENGNFVDPNAEKTSASGSMSDAMARGLGLLQGKIAELESRFAANGENGKGAGAPVVETLVDDTMDYDSEEIPLSKKISHLNSRISKAIDIAGNRIVERMESLINPVKEDVSRTKTEQAQAAANAEVARLRAENKDFDKFIPAMRKLIGENPAIALEQAYDLAKYAWMKHQAKTRVNKRSPEKSGFSSKVGEVVEQKKRSIKDIALDALNSIEGVDDLFAG